MNSLVDLDSLTDQLIRPPKFTYSIADLGEAIFYINGLIYERHDFHVSVQDLDTQQIRLNASLWRLRVDCSSKRNRLIVYMHCNCGSRVECLPIMKASLTSGNDLLAFDSRGSGHSQGRYITLGRISFIQKGFHQATDLHAVLTHVRDHFEYKEAILWGRSMGAVAIMHYLSKQATLALPICLAVLDSPFINLKEVICETINNRMGAPKILVDLFLGYLEPNISKKVGFKISQFHFRDSVSAIACPFILMASKTDEIVPFHHLEEIYNKHRGRKTIFYLEESHIQQRSTQTISKVFGAIDRYCKAGEKVMLQERHETPNTKTERNFETPQPVCRKEVKAFCSHRMLNLSQEKGLEHFSVGSGRKKIILTCRTSTKNQPASVKDIHPVSIFGEAKNQRPISLRRKSINLTHNKNGSASSGRIGRHKSIQLGKSASITFSNRRSELHKPLNTSLVTQMVLKQLTEQRQLSQDKQDDWPTAKQCPQKSEETAKKIEGSTATKQCVKPMIRIIQKQLKSNNKQNMEKKKEGAKREIKNLMMKNYFKVKGMI